MKNFSIAILLIFCLTSCGSYLTDFENVSKSKNNYEKIVIVAKTTDEILRMKFENEMVQHFDEKGIKAVASYTLNEMKDVTRKLSENESVLIEKKLVSMGYDGCIVTSFIDSKEYEQVVPGNSSTYYYPTQFGRFGRGYSYYPVTNWQPDRIEKGVKYIFESNLYLLNDSTENNLQWIGRFEVKDPKNVSQVTKEYTNDLVNILLKESINN